MDQALMQIW